MESAQRDREVAITTLLQNKHAHVNNIRVQFEKMYEQMDSDNRGLVSLDGFQEHMDDDKVSGFFILLDIDPSDASALFKLLDDDGSGQIDPDEFVDGCLRLQGLARSIDLAYLRQECKVMLKQIHNSNITQRGHVMRQLDDITKKFDDMIDAVTNSLTIIATKSSDQNVELDLLTPARPFWDASGPRASPKITPAHFPEVGAW